MDGNGDMAFGAQQADFFRDQPAAPAQAVLTRLRLWLGEWFIDSSEGTPYQQAVLGMHTQQTAEPAMRRRILETEGVTGIESFAVEYDKEERKATVNAIINTLYGTVTVQGVL